jgi:4-amino-4-deoxy-L-arabinose transferase-like glycosyltransferase
MVGLTRIMVIQVCKMRRPSLLVAFWLVMGILVLTNFPIVMLLLAVVVSSFRHRELVGEWRCLPANVCRSC